MYSRTAFSPENVMDNPVAASSAGAEDPKIVFRVLVEAQDAGRGVRDSREFAAGKFALSVERVKEIEREGLDNGWPPL
jgi:hypothetical protein